MDPRPNVMLFRAFDWTKFAGEPFIGMAKADHALREIAKTTEQKALEIGQDRDFSDSGRRNQIRQWFIDNGVPVLRQAKDAIDAADQASEGVISAMRNTEPDKTDLAGALLRQEIRAQFRAMDPARRTALVSGAEVLEPIIALAIMEAPAALSGVTPEQKARLTTASRTALNPDEARKIERIDTAKDALAWTMDVAVRAMTRSAQVTAYEIDEMLARPTLGQRLASMVDGGGEAA